MRWNSHEWNMEIFNYYRKLIEVRKRYKMLTEGSFELINANNNIYAFKRSYKKKVAIAVLNNGKSECSLDIGVEGTFYEIFSGQLIRLNSELTLVIPKKTALLLVSKKLEAK